MILSALRLIRSSAPPHQRIQSTSGALIENHNFSFIQFALSPQQARGTRWTWWRTLTKSQWNWRYLRSSSGISIRINVFRRTRWVKRTDQLDCTVSTPLYPIFPPAGPYISPDWEHYLWLPSWENLSYSLSLRTPNTIIAGRECKRRRQALFKKMTNKNHNKNERSLHQHVLLAPEFAECDRIDDEIIFVFYIAGLSPASERKTMPAER